MRRATRGAGAPTSTPQLPCAISILRAFTGKDRHLPLSLGMRHRRLRHNLLKVRDVKHVCSTRAQHRSSEHGRGVGLCGTRGPFSDDRSHPMQ